MRTNARPHLAAGFFLAALWLGCSAPAAPKAEPSARRPGVEPTPDAPARAQPVANPSTPVVVPETPTRYPEAKRIAAIGDVHGDVGAARAALRLAGAIDDNDSWTGGKLVVVQTGDQLDRGDDEREILDLFDKVAAQAHEAGGALRVLNGNHEYMNAMGDFRYVTPGGLQAFASERSDAPELARFPEQARGRAAAFLPGGTFAKRLAARNAVIIVGDSVFVHGGVLPKYAREVDRINELGRQWLAGALPDPTPAVEKLMAQDSVIWTRLYSEPTPNDDACRQLSEALGLLSATRMVVGHTVQKGGITSACDDKVWRIDTGMAAHYGGRPSVLMIEGGKAEARE